MGDGPLEELVPVLLPALVPLVEEDPELELPLEEGRPALEPPVDDPDVDEPELELSDPDVEPEPRSF